MIKLGVSIMAHKKRERYIPALLEQLGLPESSVIWDRRNDRWDTGRRAWEAYDPSCTHWCVIQDDAVVCKDFIAGMEKALAYLPEKALVSPYTGTRRPVASRVERAVHAARAANASWIRMPSLNWGVGILAPTDIINKMLPWCDKQTYPNYDRRIGRYAIDMLRLPTYCTWPSLVDHRDDDSLVGHGRGRKAHQFLGEEVSAMSVKWDSTYVDLSPKTVVGRRFPKRPSVNSFNPQPPDEISGLLNPRVAQNRQRSVKPASALRVSRDGDAPPKRPS